MDPVHAHAIYALAWVAFGLIHSLLIRDAVKNRLQPVFGNAYRLAYNGFAIVHTAATLGVGWLVFPRLAPFDLPGWLTALQAASFAGGCLLMALGGRSFDLARFIGLAQLRGGADDDGPLRTDGLLAFIRHPLFAAGFLILWGGAINEPGLATAVWGSLYLIVGARLEERRLLRVYGAAYADYRRRVPAFIPWKGRSSGDRCRSGEK